MWYFKTFRNAQWFILFFYLMWFYHIFDQCSSTKLEKMGGGPRVVVSTAAFHARVRGSVPGLGALKETKLFLPHPRVKVSIVGSLRDREVACSASDRQGSNFESCVWKTVSSQSSHHPQEVLLAQFSLYVHKGGLKPDSFHLQNWKYKNICYWHWFRCAKFSFKKLCQFLQNLKQLARFASLNHNIYIAAVPILWTVNRHWILLHNQYFRIKNLNGLV